VEFKNPFDSNPRLLAEEGQKQFFRNLLEVDYIRLFDVGSGGAPPCALYGATGRGIACA